MSAPPATFRSKAIRVEHDALVQASGQTFSRRGGRWLVGIGAVSLLATLLLSVLTSDDKPSRYDVRPNVYSRSAVGHKALAAVLEALSIDVTVSRHRSAEKASRTRPLLLVEPIMDSPASVKRLYDLVTTAVKRKVPVVLVLPKWAGEDSVTHDWARSVSLVDTSAAETVLEEVDRAISNATDTARTVDWTSVVWRSNSKAGEAWLDGEEVSWRVALTPVQGLTTSDYGPLQPHFQVDADDAYPVLIARFQHAPVYVVSDPDLVNTMGLGEADHVAILYNLLNDQLGADGVVIDEAVHGFNRADSIWSELFRFPLVLVTFHVALLFTLALWAALRRFGRPLERPPRVARGKHTLLDNTATLLALGHHAGHGVREYFRATMRSLARTYGLPTELSDDDRLRVIADLAKRRGVHGDVIALAAQAKALADRKGDERRALHVARDIHRFRMEMTDGAATY